MPKKWEPVEYKITVGTRPKDDERFYLHVAWNVRPGNGEGSFVDMLNISISRAEARVLIRDFLRNGAMDA